MGFKLSKRGGGFMFLSINSSDAYQYKNKLRNKLYSN